MTGERLDRVADAIRLTTAQTRGINPDLLLSFDRLKASEQEQWRTVALAALEAA